MDTTSLTDTDENYYFIRIEAEQHWTVYRTGS